MRLENNLRTWRESASLSREQLAEKAGTSAVSIFRIENGQQQPRTALLEAICSIFNRSPSEFYSSRGNVIEVSVGSRRIPICDFVRRDGRTVIEHNPDVELEEYVFTDLNPSPESFALRIRGRSMEPDFKEGDLVIIDPAVPPHAEDFVLAVNDQGEANFKCFHEVGLNETGQNVFELVSLNPAFPAWRSDRMQITLRGTMIEHRRLRRR